MLAQAKVSLFITWYNFFMLFSITFQFYFYMVLIRARFREHFYSGDNVLRLSHLTSFRQRHDDSHACLRYHKI
jgi:hypothetical protein